MNGREVRRCAYKKRSPTLFRESGLWILPSPTYSPTPAAEQSGAAKPVVSRDCARKCVRQVGRCRTKRNPAKTNLAGLRYSRQRPTLPRTYARSTIGGNRLNFRVRNGNGCDPAPMTTGKLNVKDPQRLPGHTPGALGTGAPQGERRKTEYPATVVVRPRTRRCSHICAELLLSAKEVIGQAARLISTS